MSMTRLGISMTLAALGIAAAGPPAPAAKQFLQAPAIYLTVEVTAKGEGNSSGGAVTEGSHRTSQSLKFTLPLDMGMPDTCPPSTQAVSMEDAMEQGRCTAWSAQPPAEEDMEKLIGMTDLSKNPMFLPVQYSIDDVSQARLLQDLNGSAMTTMTSKGQGVVYVGRSGMLLCDAKRMACDLNGVTFDFQDGADRVTVTTTSDAPGSETKREMHPPARMLPRLPATIVQKLTGFTLTLPEPSTVTFSAPDPERKNQQVTLKLTLSSKPPKAAAPAR